MKRLLPLFCILVILFASAGVASAAPPDSGTFTISGSTTALDWRVLPSGRSVFDLTAEGTSSGRLEGTFIFQEQGNVDYNFDLFQGPGNGTNHAVMTITKPAPLPGEVVVRFDGKTDGVSVSGNWRVTGGSGSYARLHGEGTYTGNAGLEFTVIFTGKFH